MPRHMPRGGPAGPTQRPWTFAATKDRNQNRNSATTGPGAGSPNNTHQIVTRIRGNRGQALVENTPQVNRSGILMHTIRTGRTRTTNLMEHSTDSIDGKYFKSARDSHPATNLESILCGLEPDTNANIFKLYKHTPYFRNPSLPSVTSPIPHPCAPILHLHALPLR